VKKDTLVHVSQLLKRGKRIQLKLPPEPQYSVVGDVRVDVRVTRSGQNVLIRGSVRFTQQLECSRCLKEIRKMRTERIEALYVPATDLRAELQLKEGDMDTLFYDGDSIDLEQLVRDAIILSIPMSPHCRSDCKGLCPGCGRNLNEEECSCKERAVDPRWKALGKLLH
jgi:uncharacterized protein